MKRYIVKLALLTLGLVTLVSCDEDTVTYGGQNFVSFDKVASTRYNAFENIGTAEIPVNMAFPKSNDVVVNFKIENSTGVEGVDYTVLTPGSVTIPAGETTGYIKIQITNNEILNDSKSLEITLTGISDSSIALGISDKASAFKRFLIVNDDCTTNFLPFVSQYNVINSDDVVIGTASADVNENGDCNVLRLTGLLEDIAQTGTDEGTYIDITLVPGGSNKNGGTIISDQQFYCAKCFQYPDAQTNNDVLLKISGGFSNTTISNPQNGIKQLTINAAFYLASSTSPLTTANVRLRAVN